MPYKVVKTGVQYCVHKKNTDGSAGKKIACHATRTKAHAQIAAIEASEKAKEQEMNKDITVNPETQEAPPETQEKDNKDNKDQKHYTDVYVPWGVYSFADLEKADNARAAALRVKTLSDQFVEIVYNIMASDDIENKDAAVTSLASEYSLLINKGANEAKETTQTTQTTQTWTEWVATIPAMVKTAVNEAFNNKDEPEPKEGFMLWKEGDQLRWLTRYSNNFRDRDNPPEIISAKSHQRFVDMVDNKEADMPELWLWHVPEWKLGKADWLAYDTAGFALASGYIDRGKEIVAEQIAKQRLVGVSHGMPPSSIERDPDDPTVIVGHESAEISPLPMRYAANEVTGWILLGEPTKEGNNMPIPENKKNTLVDEWKMDADLLVQLEAMNKADAEKATEEGREKKEKTADEPVIEEEAVEETTEETTETEEPEEEETIDPAEEAPSRQEVADAVSTVLQPFVELTQSLDERLKELEKSDEEKVATKAAFTPSASVGALLAQKFSAIGDDETRIRKNSKLANSAPEETKPEAEGPFSIRYLNEIVAEE
jgi:hypothetical protein